MGKISFTVIFACLLIISTSAYLSNDGWAEPGLRIVDQYAYPIIDVKFESNIIVSPVCTERDDPRNRYTCAFANNRINEIQKAKAIVSNLIPDKQIDEFNQIIPSKTFDTSMVINEKDCLKKINQNNEISCQFTREIKEELVIAELAFQN